MRFTAMPEKNIADTMYIKPGMQVGIFNAPDNLSELLGELPENVDIAENLEGADLDLVLGFIEDKRMLEAYLQSLKEAVKDDGSIWIAYHKGTSTDTDLRRDSIYNYALDQGLEAVAMASIDENWSGFRFKKV